MSFQGVDVSTQNNASLGGFQDNLVCDVFFNSWQNQELPMLFKN